MKQPCIYCGRLLLTMQENAWPKCPVPETCRERAAAADSLARLPGLPKPQVPA